MIARSLIVDLSRTQVEPHSFNQYAGADPGGAGRRHNLALYLQRMHQVRPSVLLVGEAAGYRGCRLTGIPFTSERLLLSSKAGLLGQENGFRLCGPVEQPRGEATATIVWQAVARFKQPPLLWNAYPFHPHRPGRPNSNRKPRLTEIDRGGALLARLLDAFAIRHVVAVGRTAERALTRLGVDHTPVRHPSHGGKAAFLTGLDRWLVRD